MQCTDCPEPNSSAWRQPVDTAQLDARPSLHFVIVQGHRDENEEVVIFLGRTSVDSATFRGIPLTYRSRSRTSPVSLSIIDRQHTSFHEGPPSNSHRSFLTFSSLTVKLPSCSDVFQTSALLTVFRVDPLSRSLDCSHSVYTPTLQASFPAICRHLCTSDHFQSIFMARPKNLPAFFSFAPAPRISNLITYLFWRHRRRFASPGSGPVLKKSSTWTTTRTFVVSLK